MADSSKDDIANALRAFSAGNSSDRDDHEDGAAPATPPAPQQRAPSAKVRAQSPLAQGETSVRPLSPIATPNAKLAQRLPTVPPSALTEKDLRLKRTIIPLLLTLGVILALGGLCSIVMGEDSPLGAELMLPLVMIWLGLLILVAGVITMLQVKNLLSSKTKLTV